jgi:hypothetical protein
VLLVGPNSGTADQGYKAPPLVPSDVYCIIRKGPSPYVGSGGPNCFEFMACFPGAGAWCTAQDVGQNRWVCGVSPAGARSGWNLDPSAHPPGEPVAFRHWATADHWINLLSPYGGDAYGCNGPPQARIPPRTPPVRTAPAVPGYCIIRNADL